MVSQLVGRSSASLRNGSGRLRVDDCYSADALTPHGELLVRSTPWRKERVLPALRDLLKLSFEKIIVAHGYPVHTRSDFEQPLERPPGEA